MEKQNQKRLDLLASNIAAVKSLVSSVKGTLGPKGLDVMLVDEFGKPNCTNDGVEILANLKVNHPVSKLVSDALKAQEIRAGDGTTSTAILIEALLDSAYDKIHNGAKIHQLIQGINIACNKFIELIKESSIKVSSLDDHNLFNLVKISAREDLELTELVLKAAKKLSQINQFDLSEAVFGSTLMDSQVIDGLIIKKKTHFTYQNKSSEEIDCLIIEGPLEPEPISSEAVNTDEGVKKFSFYVQSLMETAKKVSKAGIKAVFTSSSIYPNLEEFFVKEGIFVLSHIKKSDLNKLIQTSGSRLSNRTELANFEISSIKESAGTLESIKHCPELDAYIFAGENFKQASIVINAETETVLEERQRICIDSIRTLENALESGFVLGEGVAELNLIDSIQEIKSTLNPNDKDIGGGIDVFVEAMKSIFMQILENADLDSEILIQKIKASNKNFNGVNLETGESINLLEAGILDSSETKISAFRIASEITSQILKINLIVQSK